MEIRKLCMTMEMLQYPTHNDDDDSDYDDHGHDHDLL